MDIANDVFQIDEEYKNNRLEKANKLIELWNRLPDPQVDVLNSFLIISIVVSVFTDNNLLNEALEWAQKGLPYSGNVNLIGESEFLVGKAAFACGDYDTAKKYFTIAYKNSKKRLFRGENPEYLNLVDIARKKS